MENITIFGNGFGRGVSDESVDMYSYLDNDKGNPIFLGNVFPLIGRYPIEKFYEYGVLGDDFESNFLFLSNLNMYFEKHKVVNIIPLTEHTILFEYESKKRKKTMYYGLNNCYYRYVRMLIDGINKIDVSKIDVTDVFIFELSNERQKLSTQNISVTYSTPNERCLRINEIDFINYLLHILPQYLPSDIGFHSSVIDIINDDKNNVSDEFRNTLWEISHKYFIGMKTKINSVDISKVD